MSLTSTTTRDRFANAIPFSLTRMGAVMAGLAIAVWIGMAISGTMTPGTAATSSNSLTHEEFVRLNTTDLPAWHAVESPAISPAEPDTGATTVSNADKDAYFLYINTTALDGVVSNGDEPPHRQSGPR